MEIAGTPYRLFQVVHISKLKKVKTYPDRPTNALRVTEADQVLFDEAILPEYIWKDDLEDNEYEVERIADVRSGRKTRFGRIHRQLLVYWKGCSDSEWVDEAGLYCGDLLLDFDCSRASRNRFEVMHSNEKGLQN